MKKQIDFDFDKWGQEGISVEIDRVKVLKMHQNNILGLIYGIDSLGLVFNRKAKDLIMYEEVKPWEFWVNVYEEDTIFCAHETKEKALENRTINSCGTIKVVEVIE